MIISERKNITFAHALWWKFFSLRRNGSRNPPKLSPLQESSYSIVYFDSICSKSWLAEIFKVKCAPEFLTKNWLFQLENFVQVLLPNHTCCWFHGSRIISAASNLVFWTLFRTKTCCVVCHSYCFCYSAINMARKMPKKPSSIRLLRWFDFSQSENRKTIDKPLKEIQWNQQLVHLLRD